MFEHKIQMLVYTHYLKFHNYYKAIFFRHLHISYRCVTKIIPQSTGFVRLSPENFDNITVSGESVIFGG